MKGEVAYLYAFDVANEIITPRVQEILSERPFPFEIRMDRTLPKDVPLYKPLAVEPPALLAKLQGAPVRLLIRIYDVGVVTVMMRAAFEIGALAELVTLHNPKLENGESPDAVASKLCAQVCDSLKNLMVGRTEIPMPEAYTVFCFTDLDGVKDANQWLGEHRRGVAGLLTETAPENLSETQVTEVLRIQRSFESTDLAVIDWDAALVVDLTGYVDDVLYALELANLQLEEFRVMDSRLDKYLDRAYDDLERRPLLPFFGAANKMLRHLRHFRVDVAKLADEVTHITKFFGDWHLARVYLGARDRFYLDQWRTSVEQRLAQLDKLYSVVHTEINERRMLWLEFIIVVFFAIDLVILLSVGR
ncbi:MAG TPA: hypothetical protein VHG89_02065 [Verrucomicrobiae bacterium]|nr:hypothetical protein [Verrucomicrobiae bacterium]